MIYMLETLKASSQLRFLSWTPGGLSDSLRYLHLHMSKTEPQTLPLMALLFFLWFSVFQRMAPLSIYLVAQVRHLKILLDSSFSLTPLSCQSPGSECLSPNHPSGLSPFLHPDKTLPYYSNIFCPYYSSSLQLGFPVSGLVPSSPPLFSSQCHWADLSFLDLHILLIM